MDNSIDTNCSDFNTFGFELQELRESLNVFLNKNQLLIEKFKQIRDYINRMKTSCDIAKCVGTGLRTFGRIILGQLTNREGLLWLGSGLAIFAGSLTTFGTDFFEILKTKDFYSVLRLLAQQRNSSVQDLCSKFAIFDKLLAKKFPVFGNNLSKINDLLKELKEFNLYKFVSKVKSNANLDQTLDNSLQMIGVQSLSSTIVVFTDGSSALAGLAFSAVDIFFLIMCWNRNHLIVKVIDALIQDLENDLQLIQKVNQIIVLTQYSLV